MEEVIGINLFVIWLFYFGLSLKLKLSFFVCFLGWLILKIDGIFVIFILFVILIVVVLWSFRCRGRLYLEGIIILVLSGIVDLCILMFSLVFKFCFEIFDNSFFVNI